MNHENMTAPGEPCRPYLILPARFEADFAATFESALEAGEVACALLPASLGDDPLTPTLRGIANGRGVALLIADDWRRAQALGLDGVHVGADEAAYADARAGLGPDAIVGAHAGLSRHMGMVLAEAGADYVAFGDEGPDAQSAMAEMIGWWAELVEAPCIAWEVESLERARAVAARGADFVAVSDLVWKHPRAAAEAVRALADVLAVARRAA